MHIPLTPDANLQVFSEVLLVFDINILDEFFGLDIVHPMDTSNTITNKKIGQRE